MKLIWPEATGVVAIGADDVHVWAVPLGQVRAPWHELEAVLTADERARAERFVRDEPRRCFVVARAALRSILASYLATSAADVSIAYDPRGKPRLGGAQADGGLRFNVAHSGELALVAVTRGCEVGVDVERVRPVEHRQEIAARYFHPLELDGIEKAAPTRAADIFLRCWTRKEAVLKAIGVGMGHPLEAFCVPLDDAASWVELPAHGSSAAARCWLQHLEPVAGYVAAVATVDEKKRVTGWTRNS